MTRSAQIIQFPAVSPRDSSVAALADVPSEAGVAAPFVTYLDPARLRAVVDDRPDCAELLRSRAVPDDGDTVLDFRLLDLFSDDPALGGKIGLAVMLLCAAGLGIAMAVQL